MKKVKYVITAFALMFVCNQYGKAQSMDFTTLFDTLFCQKYPKMEKVYFKANYQDSVLVYNKDSKSKCWDLVECEDDKEIRKRLHKSKKQPFRKERTGFVLTYVLIPDSCKSSDTLKYSLSILETSKKAWGGNRHKYHSGFCHMHYHVVLVKDRKTIDKIINQSWEGRKRPVEKQENTEN